MNDFHFLIIACLILVTLGALAAAWLFRRRWVQERKTEVQLKFSNENLDFALQSGRMGTWDINLADGSIQCSQQMLDLWGVTAREFNCRRSILQSKVHADDLHMMNAAIDKAIATDGIYELAFRIWPEPGKLRWVLSRGRCTFVPGSHTPEKFSGVVFDITESMEREAALKEAIHTRDQFLTIAGHELKTPLTNLQLQIQLRQRDLQRNYPQAFTAEKISAGLIEQLDYVRRLTHLVDNMLDVAQISEGRMQLSYEYFDLCKLIQDVVDRFRESGESRGVELRFTGCHALYGNWDWFRLEQVLLNLLSNAVQYGNNQAIDVTVKQEAEHVHIFVKDRGVGIAKADHSRIFQRFERAISENEASGMGLGLFIANTIVQMHGGDILVESEIGAGSEFTVILPMQQGIKS